MTNTDELCEVVITAPAGEWLIDFCRSLVSQKLVASVHAFDRIRSIYEWRGEARDHPESRVALHTRVVCVPRIIEVLAQEHPYEVPGIVAVPIIATSEQYATWVREQTQA